LMSAIRNKFIHCSMIWEQSTPVFLIDRHKDNIANHLSKINLLF
jgi:hypothetical protein